MHHVFLPNKYVLVSLLLGVEIDGYHEAPGLVLKSGRGSDQSYYYYGRQERIIIKIGVTTKWTVTTQYNNGCYFVFVLLFSSSCIQPMHWAGCCLVLFLGNDLYFCLRSFDFFLDFFFITVRYSYGRCRSKVVV